MAAFDLISTNGLLTLPSVQWERRFRGFTVPEGGAVTRTTAAV